MAAIPPPTDTTISRIYASYEAKPEVFSRRLGASQIGRPCDRELWYSFRHAKLPKWSGRMKRLFQKGSLEEACLAADLKAIGVEFLGIDEGTGVQFEFIDCFGHFVCKLDGVLRGIPESTKWHTVEFKTANDKSFTAIEKDGCKKAKPEHFAQCQVGMGLADLDRCVYLVVNKNDESMYMERIHFDPKEFKRIIQRAKEIIFAREPPEQLSDSPADYRCKYCNFNSICHDCGEVALKNCRTCVFSEPTETGDGEWGCNSRCEIIDEETQKVGCQDHQYMPGMAPTIALKVAKAFDGKIRVDG